MLVLAGAVAGAVADTGTLGGTVAVVTGMPGGGVSAGALAGGCGMYRGPVWPQPDRAALATRASANAEVDFTIRITVGWIDVEP